MLIDEREVNMREPIWDDEAPSPELSPAPPYAPPYTPESEKSFPARHDTPYPGFSDENNSDE